MPRTLACPSKSSMEYGCDYEVHSDASLNYTLYLETVRNRCDFDSTLRNYTTSIQAFGGPSPNKQHLTGSPFLLSDDEHIVEEEEVDLLFGHPL